MFQITEFYFEEALKENTFLCESFSDLNRYLIELRIPNKHSFVSELYKDMFILSNGHWQLKRKTIDNHIKEFKRNPLSIISISLNYNDEPEVLVSGVF